jgi:hypothetical protein
MKKFEEMDYSEQKEVAQLFADWLRPYCHEVIVKVIAKRDEIVRNDFAIGLMKELQKRQAEEINEFDSSIEFMMNDFDSFSKYDPNSHVLAHANSYRDVLYDMFIRDI